MDEGKCQGNKIINYIPKKLSNVGKTKIDNTLYKLFYLDFQPFSIVEDQGFKAFVHELNPSYELPNRQTISKVIIPGLFEKCMFNLKNYFSTMKPFVCLTTDCWTSINNESFMAVTVHFINSQFHLESVLLNCSVFYDSHTSENLSKELLAIVKEWGLENKIALAISDNAANVKGAINMIGWKFLGCYAHTLNLIVRDALNLPEIKFTLDKVKLIVSHFKRSTKASLKLTETQNNLGVKPTKKIIQDVATRWNSTFYMVERFVELEPSIRSTIALLDADLPILVVEEWILLKHLCKILKPFEQATKSISGENYMSGSLVIVITNGLLDVCEKLLNITELTDLSKNVIKKLQAGLQDRVGNVEYSNTLAISTYLDPRFKSFVFKNADAAERVRKNVGTQCLICLD